MFLGWVFWINVILSNYLIWYALFYIKGIEFRKLVQPIKLLTGTYLLAPTPWMTSRYIIFPFELFGELFVNQMTESGI